MRLIMSLVSGLVIKVEHLRPSEHIAQGWSPTNCGGRQTNQNSSLRTDFRGLFVHYRVSFKTCSRVATLPMCTGASRALALKHRKRQ